MKKSLCADQRYCHFTNPISILHLTDTDNNYYNRNNTKNANANANTIGDDCHFRIYVRFYKQSLKFHQWRKTNYDTLTYKLFSPTIQWRGKLPKRYTALVSHKQRISCQSDCHISNVCSLSSMICVYCNLNYLQQQQQLLRMLQSIWWTAKMNCISLSISIQYTENYLRLTLFHISYFVFT